MTDADNPDGVDPGSRMRPVEPPMGSTTFRIVSILPKAELLSVLADPDANTDDLLDSEGFHVTDTVDDVSCSTVQSNSCSTSIQWCWRPAIVSFSDERSTHGTTTTTILFGC
jgi:hypothetical protein